MKRAWTDTTYCFVRTSEARGKDSGDFRELKAGNNAVTVVEPAYAWFFFAMEDGMIDAVTDKLLYPEVYVRCQARER